MNREIKFRAWDSVENRMREWDELKTLDARSWTDYAALMQFTGLKDKNGKEIYEGDIIEFQRAGKNVRRVVEWENEGGGWLYVHLNPLSNEVIGNVYENGDLLK